MIAIITEKKQRACFSGPALKCFLFFSREVSSRALGSKQLEADRSEIQKVELQGAECSITAENFACFDISETETSVIGCRNN